MESNFDQTEQPSNLEINRIAKDYLYETAKWGKFLGIMGFIVTGLMIVFGIFYSFILSSVPNVSNDGFYQVGYLLGYGLGFTLVYILAAVLYFFPALYLFRYSSKLKIAIQTSNSQELVNAFSNQKSLYKYSGIFTIIVLGFYALALLIMLAGLAIGGLF